MRTNPQNDCLHKWCRVIRDHVNAAQKKQKDDWNRVAAATNNKHALSRYQDFPQLTEETIKELILLKLGNTKEIMGEKVAMRSHKYRATDEELTPAERKAGHIAMNELLMAVEVWANMDLGLKLVRDEDLAA